MQRSWTDQEAFWAGSFGDEYSQRNRGVDWVASNTAFFARIFGHTGLVDSVLELGANIGLNLRAIRNLLPQAQLSAVEINGKAVDELNAIGGVEVHQTSILDYQPAARFDFVFTKNVLIHLDPAELPRAYDAMHRASSRFLMVCEYYSPTPVEVVYRGHSGKLFKRDFAGELLDRFPDLGLEAYGFVYRRDVFFQDDVTWFLLRKR